MDRLTRADVPADTEALARFLIGMRLVRTFDDGTVAVGRIVETEAYTPGDPSSHAFRGPTDRNRTMFRRHLHAYVYVIYGTYFCLNISSEDDGIGAAILIRAIEPLAGLDAMRARRGGALRDRDLARGPGRLCIAVEIDRRLDGIDLEVDDRLWLASANEALPPVGISTRIGLSKAIDFPHRFYACGSRFVSGPRALSPRDPGDARPVGPIAARRAGVV